MINSFQDAKRLLLTAEKLSTTRLINSLPKSLKMWHATSPIKATDSQPVRKPNSHRL